MSGAPSSSAPAGELEVYADARDILRKGASELTIEANGDQRAAIAKRLNLLSVDKFSAVLKLVPWQGAGVEVTGQLVADVVQACVVTLEPVPESLCEPVLIRFEGRPAGRRKDSGYETEEVLLLDPDAPDPPDPMPEDSRLPLGELLIQLLSVALDPYPRKGGAALQDVVSEGKNDKIPPDHPFAALASLKKPR